MKKTLITLLALSGIAMGDGVPSTALFDFDAADITTPVKSLSLESNGYTITLTTTGSALGSGTYSSPTITSTDTPADDLAATAGTYISSGGKGHGLSFTLSGLTAGNTYDVDFLTGVPFEGQGLWNTLSISNTYSSTSYAFDNSGVLQVKSVTHFDVNQIVADENGNITFTFNTEGFHTPALNGLSITGVIDAPGDGVPEPTTATLSLLALAGLAARRRRR